MRVERKAEAAAKAAGFDPARAQTGKNENQTPVVYEDFLPEEHQACLVEFRKQVGDKLIYFAQDDVLDEYRLTFDKIDRNKSGMLSEAELGNRNYELFLRTGEGPHDPPRQVLKTGLW